MKREAGKAFTDGVEDQDIKISLLIGGEKTVNEALRQALELQAVFLAARLHKTSTKTLWRSRSPPTRRRDARKSASWNCREPGHFMDNCRYERKADNDRRWKEEERPIRDTREASRRSECRPSYNEVTNRRGGLPSGNERGPAERGGRRRIQ
jgi:hypothetical protein